MTYASVADVRAVGVPAGTLDPAIAAAILAAMERVDAYTEGWWESRAASVTASVTADGTARLPRPPLTVTAVEVLGPATPVALDASTWRIETSSDLGSLDRLYLNGWSFGGYDTIAGFESYRNPLDRPALFDRRIRVTGTFGTATTPDVVRDATALIAAALVPSPYGEPSEGAVNTEGDADLGVPPVVPRLVVEGGTGTASTGHPVADAMLVPYRRRRGRVS